jgi:signal transduction histidine kinase
MYLRIALLLSIAMQIATAMIAIGLIKKTKFNISWILISAALLMMAVRLLYELPQVVDGVIVDSVFGKAISWIGVLISLCFLVGIAFINKIFNKIIEADLLRTEMDKKVLDAIIKTEESERKRVAKELHDGLGPLISNLKMSISALSIPENSDQKEMVRNMKQVVNESLSTIREISNNLSPHVLDSFGLLSALKAFTGKIAERKIIAVDIEGNIQDRRFSLNIEITVYRVLCELINNTLRHSGANSVFIRLIEADGYLFISYRDNGKGLPPGMDLSGHPGMGFSNIESRLKAVNGKIELNNPEIRGFSVSITCPAYENM